MASTIYIEDASEIGLEEYLDYVETSLDLNDFSSLEGGAPMFKRLLNNKNMLRDRVNTELKSWRDFQRDNGYSGMVLLLAANEQYVIRANIWKPAAEYSREWLSDDQVFSYLNVHNHNFSFMTGGYFGAGYNTSIWEWDEGGRERGGGEHVDLRFLEHTSLPEGKIMLYRTTADIHRQEHASALSISLNLMVRPPPGGPKQYRFDLETSTISSSSLAEATTRMAICDIAAMIADENTTQILSDIAGSHVQPAARRSALGSLAKIKGLTPDELVAAAAEPERQWAASIIGGAPV
jgi:hypothetical protein